jgi:hypothetical protein
VEESNLVKGERTLNIVSGLPPFVVAQGDDALRGATVKVVAGAGIGQTRLVIFNTATSITVSNPWIEALDETSRIEILRYEGVVLPVTLVQIVGDDGNAIDLRETGGDTVAFEAPEVHGFVDIGGDDLDDVAVLQLVDTVTVSLTQEPGSNVTVDLYATDSFFNPQPPSPSNRWRHRGRFAHLHYDGLEDAQTVYVFGDDDLLPGFHKVSHSPPTAAAT